MTSSDGSSGSRKRLLLLAAAALGTLGALAVAAFRAGDRTEGTPDVGDAVEVAIEGAGGLGTETVGGTDSVVETVDPVEAVEPDDTDEPGEPLDPDEAAEPDDAEPEPTTQATFECYRDGTDAWRWRLTHRNGRNLARSPRGYEDRERLDTALETVREVASGIDDFDVYEDGGGKWRWRLADDDTVVAVSARGYSDRRGAVDGAESASENAAGAETEYDVSE